MLSNILLDKFNNITPNGYTINTDFRQGIKFELLMQDNKIDNKEKIILALNLFYADITDYQQQLEDIVWFYSKGKNIEKQQETKINSKQIFSYEYDSDYIFSAFLEQYNIDLNNINYLHWWKFRALFNGLSEKTKLMEIMSYRAIDLSKISDEKERKRYAKLKEIYKLPDMRTEREKESDFGNALW